jgi:hypothetical protein
MLAAITSEMADIVRSRAWNASRRQSRKPFSLLRGTEGFESIPLQRRESRVNLIRLTIVSYYRVRRKRWVRPDGAFSVTAGRNTGTGRWVAVK